MKHLKNFIKTRNDDATAQSQISIVSHSNNDIVRSIKKYFKSVTYGVLETNKEGKGFHPYKMKQTHLKEVM